MPVEKKWIKRENADAETVSRLSSELGIDPVLAELLVQRGVHTFSQARSFFRPDLADLHDPFLMKDMDKAVDRVHRAIVGNEKILVYGDYDVDGTTAVSLVYSFLARLTDRIDFYIPERYDEGYGVSYKGIDWAAENGFGLIITLDCGIKANEKVDYAKGKGIDMIICDHHLPEMTYRMRWRSWTRRGKTAAILSTTCRDAVWASSLSRPIHRCTAYLSNLSSRCLTCLW